MKEDWNKKDIYFAVNRTIKRCQPEDFGEDQASQDYWHTWITDDYFFDLFCPDL